MGNLKNLQIFFVSGSLSLRPGLLFYQSIEIIDGAIKEISNNSMLLIYILFVCVEKLSPCGYL